MRQRLALSLLVLVPGSLLLKAGHDAVAEEARARKLACPSCHEPREGARCPGDGATLVPANLVVFGDTIARLAAFDVKEKGLENPFATLVGKDGLPDIAALEKLVQDYKAARAASRFTPFAGRLPLAAPAAPVTPEKGAIGALKAIATAEALFREGDLDRNGRHDYGSLAQLAAAKLLDPELGSGKKQGYVFEVAASTTEPLFRWYAKASPARPEPGARSFFTNQVGLVYGTTEPFAVDPGTCEVPPGLKLAEE